MSTCYDETGLTPDQAIPAIVKAKKELADIVASISRFDRECKSVDYTDTGDVWEVFDDLKRSARRALHALKGPK